MKNKFFKHNSSYKNGFTLAEMLLLLLVLSLVSAAYLPIISARTKMNATISGIWKFTDDNNSIYYGTGATQGVIVGNNTNSGALSKLTVNSTNLYYAYPNVLHNNSQIMFQQAGTTTGLLSVAFNPVTVYFGADPQKLYYGTQSGGIAIGGGDTSTNILKIDSGGTTIGYGSQANNYSAAFGYKAIAVGGVSGNEAPSAAFGYDAQATGKSSCAFGYQLRAVGDSSVVIGSSISTNSTFSSVTIGGSSVYGLFTKVAGDYTTAIGFGAQATYLWNTAIGNCAKASSGSYCTVIGSSYTGVMAAGLDVTLIGSGSVTALDNSTAIGSGDTALGGSLYAGLQGISIGYNASSQKTHTIAIGSLTKVLYDYGIAIGSNATTGDTSNYNMSLGNGATSNNAGIAIGSGATAAGVNSIAIGNGANTNSSTNGIAIGISSAVNGTASVACGNSAYAGGDYSTAFGQGAVAGNVGYGAPTGNYATAFNGFARTYGTAIGYSSSSGSYSVAIGAYATAANFYSAILGGSGYGYSGQITGDGVTAIGAKAITGPNTTDTHCTLIGYGTYSDFGTATAIGYNATTTADNTIVIGTSADFVKLPGTLFVKANQITTNSDRRLKNIKGPFNAGLKEIREINPKQFTFKDDKKKTPCVGVIAQDLKKVFPNAVSKAPDKYLAIRQDDMFYAMLNSIKQLDKIVQKITCEVRVIAAKVQILDNKLIALIKNSNVNYKRLQILEKQNDVLLLENTKLEGKLAKYEK